MDEGVRDSFLTRYNCQVGLGFGGTRQMSFMTCDHSRITRERRVCGRVGEGGTRVKTQTVDLRRLRRAERKDVWSPLLL